MKYIILLWMIPLLSFADNRSDVCTILAAISAQTMELHQNNVPLTQAMEIPNPDVDTKILHANIVFDAYSYPTYKTQKQKEDVIFNFGKKYLYLCMKSDIWSK